MIYVDSVVWTSGQTWNVSGVFNLPFCKEQFVFLEERFQVPEVVTKILSVNIKPEIQTYDHQIESRATYINYST